MAEDYYRTLGVSRSADQKEIHRAYRAKARKYHPDVNKDAAAEEMFKRISEAHDVLSDPEARAQYDRFGENFRQYAATSSAASGSGSSGARRPGGTRSGGSSRRSSAGMPGAGWESLFGDVFGSRGRGADLSAELDLSVDEAYHGGRRTIRLEDAHGATREYEIEIPAGAMDGQRIHIPGAGAAGAGDGDEGDLVVVLRVKNDRRYTLSGADIEMVLPISPWEAALGADVVADTPGGPITVHVPAGSSSGRRLRLRGQGMPRHGAHPGDLYARIKVVVPHSVTRKERALFEQLRDESTFEPRRAS